MAGFSPGELDVTVEANTLRVSGKSRKDEKKNVNGYVHRGIARHSFERRCSLSDHMKVTGAYLDNGMLHVETRGPRGGQAAHDRDRHRLTLPGA